MTTYRIHNTASGLDLGIWEAASADEAIRAMLADARCDDEPSLDLVAEEVEAYDVVSPAYDPHPVSAYTADELRDLADHHEAGALRFLADGRVLDEDGETVAIRRVSA
jgi:hypothetical protein